MGGGESALSMGYGVLTIIILYLLVTAIVTIVQKIQARKRRSDNDSTSNVLKTDKENKRNE